MTVPKKIIHGFISLTSVWIVLSFFILCTGCNSGKNSGEDTAILYTDRDGASYPVIARPGEVLIYFEKIPERERLRIIERLGAKIIKKYPLLRCYIVEIEPGKEMELIKEARRDGGVRSADLNIISEPMEINIHLIDDFSTLLDHSKNSVGYYHGEYCYESAKTAYNEYGGGISPFRYDTRGNFDNATIAKHLETIFATTHPDSLILLNLSFGHYIYKVGESKGRGHRPRYVENEGRYIKVTWPETFSDQYGELERNWWINNYILGIQWLSQQLMVLAETNPNFIIFKASGNDYCHEIDKSIFDHLADKLTPDEMEIVENHFLFVSAKDDDSSVPGKLYASYANSSENYCPYLTMTDISHLSHDGTSFATPFLLGLAGRRFDTVGYRSLGSSQGPGYTVTEMVDHIKERTRNYAEKIKQPGLYTDSEAATTYYYQTRYSFTGIVCCDREDLCGSGEAETYYYLKIDPINIQAKGANPFFGEPLRNVTRLQFDNHPEGLSIGQRITLEGELLFNFAGCHIHTDAYLAGCVFENIPRDSVPREKRRKSIQGVDFGEEEESGSYHFFDIAVLEGVLHSKHHTYTEVFTGSEFTLTTYYLTLDNPITVKNRNEGNSIFTQYKTKYGVKEILLCNSFNYLRPDDFLGQHVKVKGQLGVEITSAEEKGVVMYIDRMEHD